MCYGGHSNSETIKDVAFVGPNDEVVAAGSDNGCMFLWDRVSGTAGGQEVVAIVIQAIA